MSQTETRQIVPSVTTRKMMLVNPRKYTILGNEKEFVNSVKVTLEAEHDSWINELDEQLNGIAIL